MSFSSSKDAILFPPRFSSVRRTSPARAFNPPLMPLSLSSSEVNWASSGNPSSVVTPQLTIESSSRHTAESRPVICPHCTLESRVKDSTSSRGMPSQASKIAASISEIATRGIVSSCETAGANKTRATVMVGAREGLWGRTAEDWMFQDGKRVFLERRGYAAGFHRGF